MWSMVTLVTCRVMTGTSLHSYICYVLWACVRLQVCRSSAALCAPRANEPAYQNHHV